MRMPPRHTILCCLILPVMVAVAAGCDNAIDVLDASSDEYFSIYGFLDTAADTQYVRVEPIRPSPERGASKPLDAVVTGMQGGTHVTWRDSLVTLDDGSTGHLLYTTAPVQPALEYVLEVRRSDGATTVASTRLPPIPILNVDDPTARSTSGDAIWMQDLRWVNVPAQPAETRVIYEVGAGDDAPPQDVVIPYPNRGIFDRFTGMWTVSVTLTRDQTDVRFILGLDPSETVPFYGARAEIRLEGSDGPVQHGRGVLSSAATFSDEWRLPTLVLQDLHYINRQNQ